MDSYPITVSGAVDPNYTISYVDGMLSVTPAGISTTTTLCTSENPATVGDCITFTATVTAADCTSPTGTVTFFDGDTPLDTVTLVVFHGVDQAQLSISTLGAGTHAIRAVYNPTGDFAPSTSAVIDEVINKIATTTCLTLSSDSSVVVGQNITFVATVSAACDTPNGVVTFWDGTTVLATETLEIVCGVAQATFTTATLSLGSHTIRAVYEGTDTFASSTSAGLLVNIVEHDSGLVAAYSFNEGTGHTVTDLSGHGNDGTVAHATWSTGGKYGDALSFNGSSAMVNVPDSASLHLTTGMTLEAWVLPTVVSNAWRDVIYKGDDNYYLEATSYYTKPAGGVIIGSSHVEAFAGSPLDRNAWAHLALTYDGATLRLYINGQLASSTVHTGSIKTSNNPLQIGGDSIYGQFFAGLIDEVRVYNRALSAGEIQTDMNTPLGLPPVADAGGPYAIAEGSSLTLDGSASSGSGQPLSYSWDVNGDGTFGDATGVMPTLSWNQLVALGITDGPLTVNNVRVRVDNGHGSVVVSPMTTLAVNNAPPVAAISGPSAVLRGESASFTLSATDPSPVDQTDPFAFVINWGDGSPAQTVTDISGALVTHTFNTAGPITVSVTAADSDGDTSPTATRSLQVDAAQLRANAQNPALLDLVWGGTPGADRVELIETSGTTVRVHETRSNGAAVDLTQDFTGVTGRVIAYGNAGDDVLDARSLMTRQATLDGGGGNNTLYGGAAGDVLIGGFDGAEGQQGSNVIVAGNGTNTIYGNAPVGLKGSTGGNNLIVGGSGSDTVYGSFASVLTKDGQPSDGGEGGQNLIIGGGGSDTLYASQAADGGEGGHGSILIAGTTTLDESALLSILSEWTSDRSYANRVANIEGLGSGPRNNGNHFLQAGVTVFDDASPDDLFSDTHGELDWLLFALAVDNSHRVKSGETETDI